MKVLTWNVNGLRATAFGGNFSDSDANLNNNVAEENRSTKSFKSLISILNYLDADVTCFQEVKTPRDQLEESLAVLPGFISFFSFCQRKKNSAYSGVATFCKDSCAPFKVEEGLSGVWNNNASSSSSSSSAVDREEDLVGHYGDVSEFTRDQLKELDSEGRSLITQHRLADGSILSIINVYCPFGGEEGERTHFKMNFYKLLRIRATALAASGSYVVILGDINTSHHLIDHCEGDTRDRKEFYENPGRTFLSDLLLSPSKFKRKGEGHRSGIAGGIVRTEEKNEGKPRSELSEGSGRGRGRGEDAASDGNKLDDDDDDVGSNGESGRFDDDDRCCSDHLFVDAFRLFHPTRKEAFTCWNTSIGARATNFGTRIDYVFPDARLARRALTRCDILPNIRGSDHCPVEAELALEMAVADRGGGGNEGPPSATKFWPEFAGGKQKTLNSYFERKKSVGVGGGIGGGGGGVASIGGGGLDAKKSEETALSRKRVVVEGSSSSSSSSRGGVSKRPKLNDETAKRKPAKTLLDFVTKKRKNIIDEPPSQHSLPRPFSSQKENNDSGETTTTTTTRGDSNANVPASSASSSSSSAGLWSSSSSSSSSSSFVAKDKKSDNSSDAWKKLLTGPGKAPPCKGHREPCVANKVKKPGPNLGKKFYACARPTDLPSKKEARCNHFEWAPK